MTEIVSAQTTSQAPSGTIVIPAISVSEAYDTNVFYTPKDQLAPGQKPEDFITFITPQISVAHQDQFIRGSLSVGALIAKYVNNPDLDYTGVNTAGLLDLKGWASRALSQRITALSLVGTYQYTPTFNGFGSVPAGSGVGTNYGATGFGPLTAGQITNRVQTHVYTLGFTGAYLLTPTTTLTPSYTYSRISFGGQSGGQDNALFDTTGHQGAVTLSNQLTRTDTVGTTASISTYSQDQSNSTGGDTGTFTTALGTVSWGRSWTPEWSSSLAGGGNVIFAQGSVVPGQSTKTTLGPQATAQITYRSFSEALKAVGSTLGPSDGAPSTSVPFANLPSLSGSMSPGGIMSPGRYTASLLYTFSVFPAYAGASGAIRAHVLGVNAVAGITSKLTGQVGLNYALGSGGGGVGNYDTLGLTGELRYLIGPVLASLTANYLSFSSSDPGVGVTTFSKEMVMLTLATAFNSQSFFRMDGFGGWRTPSSGGGTSAPSGAEPGGGSPGAGPRN